MRAVAESIAVICPSPSMAIRRLTLPSLCWWPTNVDGDGLAGTPTAPVQAPPPAAIGVGLPLKGLGAGRHGYVGIEDAEGAVVEGCSGEVQHEGGHLVGRHAALEQFGLAPGQRGRAVGG